MVVYASKQYTSLLWWRMRALQDISLLSDKQTGRHTDTQTDRQTDRRTDIQTHRQTDRQTDRQSPISR